MSEHSMSTVTRGRNYTALLVIMLFLVALLTSLQAFQVYTTYQQNLVAAERAATRAERVRAAEAVVRLQQSAISSLMDDYAEAVYDNPSMDSIMQQQFLATEFSLTALQIIALQNSQIIELLATAP